jgi:predicted outer membrane repeat protein
MSESNNKNRSRVVGLTVLATLLSLSQVAEARICRVDPTSTSFGGGDTWSSPISLQGALNYGVSNCDELWLKQGVYTPGTDPADRSATFSPFSGVAIYGGFAGNEANRADRNPNPHTNFTILSGNNGLNNLDTDNSYHVFTIDPLDFSAGPVIIEGVTIQDGNANKQNQSGGQSNDDMGGGLLCAPQFNNTSCEVQLRQVVFQHNKALNGGALAFDTSLGEVVNGPLIEEVTFRMNHAEWSGGAISYESVGNIQNVAVSNSVFYANQADRGGAISLLTDSNGQMTATFTNVTFHGNLASLRGGAVSIQANRSSNVNSSIDPLFKNVTFTNNAANLGGGALVNYSTSTTLADPVMDNVIFWGNISYNGQPAGSPDWTIDNQGAGSLAIIRDSIMEHGCDGNVCTNISQSDPLLGVLDNNGGYTKTRVPGVGSAAIDAGNNSTCTTADQRGISRPQDGDENGSLICDIGAVEVYTQTGTCRVTEQGTSQGFGDWNDPMSLQTALNDVSCQQVWIKKGTYRPTSGSDRSISFVVRPGVEVLGGFDGFESDPGQRLNPAANLTELTGDIGGIGDLSDNSFHVLRFDGTQGTGVYASTVLADLTVKDGRASVGLFDFPNNVGGGIFCDGSGLNSVCSPMLINLIITGNHAISGGGMYNHAANDGLSSPGLINVTFEYNYADQGAGMLNNGAEGGQSSPTLLFVDFNENDAIGGSGGGMYNNGFTGFSRPRLTQVNFTNNDAAYGGGMYNSGRNLGISNPQLNQVSFTNNTATADGGAMWNAGFDGGQSRPELTDVAFTDNQANRGGAMYNNDLSGNGTAQLSRVTFANNQANTHGGAMYNDGLNGYSHPELDNVTFHQNTAVDHGGAMYNNGDNGASSPSLKHVTLVGNSANYGGAIYSTGGLSGISSSTLEHVIMWDNLATTEGAEIYHDASDATISNSLIEGGCPASGFGNNVCQNIITGDPLLAPLADNGGFTQTMKPGQGSAAVDAGQLNNCLAEDQRGQARPNGPSCDLGAVEVDFSDVIFADDFD